MCQMCVKCVSKITINLKLILRFTSVLSVLKKSMNCCQTPTPSIVLTNKKASHFCEALSEPDRIRTFDRLLRREVLYPAELRARSFKVATTQLVSGWQDSNLRPPRPKRGAMTGLRYTPSSKLLRRDRDSNPGDSYPSTD